MTIQRGTLILFTSAIGLSAIVYGYTVHTQDLWKSQYQQLKRLRTQETQQAVMNENLKQELAISAQKPDSGLVAPSPDRSVFIPSAPLRPLKAVPTPPTASATLKSKLPVGY
jgi:aminoglycoside phosphotransferase